MIKANRKFKKGMILSLNYQPIEYKVKIIKSMPHSDGLGWVWKPINWNPVDQGLSRATEYWDYERSFIFTRKTIKELLKEMMK